MAVPVTIADLSVTEGSNSPLDSDSITASTRPSDYLRAHGAIIRTLAASSTIAAAPTTDLSTVTETFITLTGTAVTITSLGTLAAGIYKHLIFNDAHTLTNSAALILPGGVNITTANGDVAMFVSEGSGNWRCTSYQRAAGALQSVYPVGSIYINAGVSTNPATLFGFGTWAAFGAGRVMVGLDAGNTAFDTAEEIGGSADATLVSHTHTATVTDPGHTHSYTFKSTVGGSSAGGDPNSINNASFDTGSSTTGITVSNSTEGASATNANLPPYIVVYMWKRTA